MATQTSGALTLEQILAPATHTPTSVARALGVSSQTVRYWMAGVMRPRLEHRLRLQALLGIPVASWERVARRGKAA